jgi:hypothetical protein
MGLRDIVVELQRSHQNNQRFILFGRKGVSIRALELNTDAEVITLLSILKLGDPGMPCSPIKGYKLSQGSTTTD